MFENRHELLTRFSNPIYIPHNRFSFLDTFECLNKLQGEFIIELLKVRVIIHSIDFLQYTPQQTAPSFSSTIRFQQAACRCFS